MAICYLHLGSNKGNRIKHLSLSIYFVEKLVGKVINMSSIYNSKAWGNTKQADFLNQAISVETKLSPYNLLDKIQFIEKKLGRKRIIKWGPRKIDIDILFYDQLVMQKDRLEIPHPHIERRNFVLKPMVEIAAEFIHPILQKSIKELYTNSEDSLEVNLFNE